MIDVSNSLYTLSRGGGEYKVEMAAKIDTTITRKENLFTTRSCCSVIVDGSTLED